MLQRQWAFSATVEIPKTCQAYVRCGRTSRLPGSIQMHALRRNPGYSNINNNLRLCLDLRRKSRIFQLFHLQGWTQLIFTNRRPLPLQASTNPILRGARSNHPASGNDLVIVRFRLDREERVIKSGRIR
jgi:hypothetical protein